MPCGLYGKLPTKRDFVAVNAPRDFLMRWEEWLQGGVAASRLSLEMGYLPAYLSAPLWRFWLGGDICGVPVCGVFMSSMDGVGRYFPLTVFCCGEETDQFALPDANEAAGWFDRVEDFLLSALDPGLDYDKLLGELEMLPLQSRAPASVANDAVKEYMKARICRASLEGLGDAFVAIAAERDRVALRGASFWWTIGGEGYEAAALRAEGLPDPNIMSAMLTGRFESSEG